MRKRGICMILVGVILIAGVSKTSKAAEVSGYIDVSKIHAKIVLQKYSENSWKAIKTYEDAVSSPIYSLNKSKIVSKGKYRVKAVFTIYKGAKSENVTKYSNTVSYSS